MSKEKKFPVAYSVQEEDEGTGGIVFAHSSAEARRLGAQEFGDGDFNWGKARRASWADPYAPGPVPKSVMLENGWWFECSGCYKSITEESELQYVEIGELLYCCQECLDQTVHKDRQRKAVEEQAILELRERLLQKMPGALPSNRGYVEIHPVLRFPQTLYASIVRISFEFPGAKHIATFDGKFVSMASEDRIAFYRWKAAGYPPHLMDSSTEDS